MRPVSVFAKGPASEIEWFLGELYDRWQRAARAVLAEDETHMSLLPHVRVGWTLHTAWPEVPS